MISNRRDKLHQTTYKEICSALYVVVRINMSCDQPLDGGQLLPQKQPGLFTQCNGAFYRLSHNAIFSRPANKTSRARQGEDRRIMASFVCIAVREQRAEVPEVSFCLPLAVCLFV